MITRFAISIAVAVFWAGVATADIIATTGDAVELVVPLASVVPPAGEQDGTIHAFAEQSGVLLGADLTVDMTVPYTTYNPPAGRTLGDILAGTTVNSYYIHFDPETFGGVLGTVTFDEPILGVIAEGDELNFTAVTDPPGDTLGPSNFLGALGTTYPDNDELLGMEDGPDRVRMYESSIKVAFGAANPGDRLRVITDPAGTVLCGNGALDGAEVCDDGNIADTDGCFGCEPETCFTCAGAPSTCNPIVTCVNADGCCAPGCSPLTDTDCKASCTKKKIKAVAKKKSCFLKEFQRSAKAGVPVNVERLGKCSARFEFAFFKAELNGGCQTTGDAPAIEAKVDAFVADLIAELDQPPLDDLNPCRVRKLKCVDAYDKCVLNLYAKATKTGFIDPIAQSKCDVKYDKCFAKAELGGGCETVGDAAAIKAKDDAFIDDATCELQVCL